jgi:hypothetical protein
MSLYEAAALGANMSVPYGAWLGSIEEDSFWAPHDLCVEIQDFLAANEYLFSRSTHHEVAVVFSIESNFQRGARRDQFANTRVNLTSSTVAIPFWEACDALSNAAHPYDVVFFPDGELRPDTLMVDDLRQYRTLILPDCSVLTPAQVQLLQDYADQGGLVLAWGDVTPDLSSHERVRVVGLDRDFSPNWLTEGPQVRVEGSPNLAMCIQRTAAGPAIHLIRYDFDEDLDATPILSDLALTARLPQRFTQASFHTPAGEIKGELTTDGTLHRLVLRDVPLYSVVTLH